MVCVLRLMRNAMQEREVMIIERLGRFHQVFTAGVHFIVPVIDRPKTFWFRCVAHHRGFTAADSHRDCCDMSGFGLERILRKAWGWSWFRERSSIVCSRRTQFLTFPKTR